MSITQHHFMFRDFAHILGLMIIAGMLMGCSNDPSAEALNTDANGYLCQGCKNKFYTEREVFANTCPNCKSMQLIQVVGFICSGDGHMTVGPRAGGFTTCEKCGKTTSGLAIPRESDLKTWGAPKKGKAEVGA